MTHRLFIGLLLLAFAWQSAPLVRAGTVIGSSGDFAHAVMHWTDAAHHHHGDGAYHQDTSGESAQHVAADHSAGSATPPAGERAHALEVVTAPALTRVSSSGPPPVLEGPLRPPRFVS
jgi:hypothetical protein